MAKCSLELNGRLLREARRLTGLKTDQEIIDKAMELLVRSESRKGILRFYGSGVWQGDTKRRRKNR